MGPVYRDTGRRAPPTRRNRGSMSTVTTIGVVDLLTIRECIEILVRQGDPPWSEGVRRALPYRRRRISTQEVHDRSLWACDASNGTRRGTEGLGCSARGTRSCYRKAGIETPDDSRQGGRPHRGLHCSACLKDSKGCRDFALAAS